MAERRVSERAIGEGYFIVGIDTGVVKVSVPQPATLEGMISFELPAEDALVLARLLSYQAERLKVQQHGG